jgi:hypothetical protein
MSNKQKDERRFSHERFIAVVNFLSKAYTHTVKWGAIVCLGFLAYKAVDSLSGHDTFVQFALSVVTDLKINKWIYLIAAGCASWAVGERRLRQRGMRTLHNRNKELEKLIDPNRTSSNLMIGSPMKKEGA